jgi:hypothetical protein
MNLKRLSSAVVAVACAAALSGCGGGTGGGTATLTREAFAAQVSAATADMTSVHLNGVVSVRGMVVNVKGDIAVNGRNIRDLVARFDVRSLLPRGSATLLVTDGVAYLKTTGFPMATKSGKPWLATDLTDPANRVAGVYHTVMSKLSPTNMAKAFRATSQLRRVGPATVSGIDTTHYVVTVDTAKALRLLGIDDVLASHAGAARKSLPKTFDYDIWIDGSQRPVRVKATHGGVSADLIFTSWGEQVSVQAPPASRVSKVSL